MSQEANRPARQSGCFSQPLSQMTAVTHYAHTVVITWADGTEETIEQYRSLAIVYA